MSGIGDKYECAVCRGTFTKTWSDEEAMAEMHDLWAETSGPVDIVCDGCFQKVAAWAQNDAPETLRNQP